VGIWRKLLDYFRTDIEVIVPQQPGAEYRIAYQSAGTGHLSHVRETGRLRIVFHYGMGGDDLNRVILVNGRHEALCFSRLSRCEMFVLSGVQGARGHETDVRLRVAAPSMILLDEGGRPISLRRFRHRDLPFVMPSGRSG